MTTTTSALPTPRRAHAQWWRPYVSPAIVLLVVLIAIFLGYRRIESAQAAETAGIQTTQVSRGNLVASVSAAGNLQPVSQVNLNLTTGGIVQDVLVKQNDQVKAGQPLLRLQTNDLALAVKGAQADLNTAQLKLQQTTASPKDTDVAQAQAKVDQAQAALDALSEGPTPAELAAAQAQVVAAQAQLAKARTGTASAGDITDARSKITSAQANLAKLKAGATPQEITDAQQKVEQAKNALWGAQSNRDAICGRPKNPDQDPSCQNARSQVNQEEAAVQIAQSDLAALQAGPDPHDVTVAEQNVTQAQANLQALTTVNPNDVTVAQQTLNQTQANLDKLRQPPTPDQVAQAKAAVDQAKASLAAVEAGSDEITVKIAQAAVDSAQVALDQAQSKLNQATLVAPFDGTVAAVNVVVGQNVSTSSNPIQMADLTSLEVVANVSELDRTRLQVGQTVQMTLDALPGVTLNGAVSSISPTGVLQQGVVTYPVTVTLTHPDPAVASGMTANMNVIVDHRDNVLLVPNRAIRTQGRQKAVTVLYEGQEISIPVQTGLTDGTNTEIMSNALKPGDQVLLTSTTATQPRGGFGGGGFAGPAAGPPRG